MGRACVLFTQLPSLVAKAYLLCAPGSLVVLIPSVELITCRFLGCMAVRYTL